LLKEQVTLEVLARKYELAPLRISTWKSQALKNFGNLFSADSVDQKDKGVETHILYARIGQLKVENDLLKKSYNDQS